MVFYRMPSLFKHLFMERSVTCAVAPNIALIKYWGKRNKELNLPLNSSISLTLSSVYSFFLL